MDLTALRETVTSCLPEEAFLVDLEFTGDTKGRILRITVDTDEGVGVGRLAEINRSIGAQLDEQEWTDKAYRLEVSSPGLKRDLDHPRLLAKAVGRKVKLRLLGSNEENVENEEDGVEGSTQLRGKLLSVSDTELELDADKGRLTVKRDRIRTVRYWLEW